LGVAPGDKVILLPRTALVDDDRLCHPEPGRRHGPRLYIARAEQIKYIINDSDAKVVIVSDRKLWEKTRP